MTNAYQIRYNTIEAEWSIFQPQKPEPGRFPRRGRSNQLNTTAGFLLLRGGASHHAASLASAENGTTHGDPTVGLPVVEIRTTPPKVAGVLRDPLQAPTQGMANAKQKRTNH